MSEFIDILIAKCGFDVGAPLAAPKYAQYAVCQGQPYMRYNLKMNLNDFKRISLWLLGTIWALPMTAIGLVLGCGALALGARLSFSDSAVVFSRFRFFSSGALTLGQVILHTGQSLNEPALTYHCAAFGGDACVRIGTHEQAHVFQYMALGIIFLPLYFLHGGISHKNRFEKAADRYAQTGSGWWPYK
jgi:hypothetical protein